MTVNVTYREPGAVVPGSTTIKNSPLSNAEIDGNFKSVKDAVEVLSTTGGAALIGVAPVGGVAATTVQAAISELDSEKAGLTALAAPSGSSLVGYDTGTVQDVLDAVTGPTGAASVGYTPAGTGAVVSTAQARLRQEVFATDYMTEGSSDISDGIKKALSANAGKAVTVKVPRRADQLYWDWSQEIDLASFDSWVSIKADGFVPCKATASLSSFIAIGKSNKSNAGFVSGLSFNAGNYNHGCAVKVGASRSFTVKDIELKADGTGKYTDGVVFDESINTSGEQGSGFELNVVDNIIDSGDSSVTGSMVRFKNGSVRGVTTNNIRATRDSFTHVVSNDAGVAVIGGQISNIQATFISQRMTPCDALVRLRDAVDAIDIHNIYTLDGTANASCNYAVKITSSTGTPKRIYLGNCAATVAVKQYDIAANAATVFTNFRTKNAGKPDEAGAMFANAAIRPQGALVWDTVNKVLWTENDGAFEAAFDKRYSVINDDSVLAINVGTTDDRTYGGMISIAVEGQPTYSGIVFWRTAVSSVCSQITSSVNLNTTTGVLTGTTGVDTKVTVSADTTSGKIYIENRTGAGRRFHVSFI